MSKRNLVLFCAFITQNFFSMLPNNHDRNNCCKRFIQGLSALAMGGTAAALSYQAFTNHSRLMQEQLDNNYCIDVNTIPQECIASLAFSALSAFGSAYFALEAIGCSKK